MGFDLGKLSKQRVVLLPIVIRPREQLIIEPFEVVSLSFLPRYNETKELLMNGTDYKPPLFL